MENATAVSNPHDGSVSTTKGSTMFVEWVIADYKHLLREKKFGTIAKSPTFQMKSANWNLQISHLLSTLGEKLVLVYLLRHQSKKRYHSITHMVTVQVNEKDICGGYRKTFVFGKTTDEFCSIVVTEKELLNRMTSDTVTVLCTVFPDTEEQNSESKSRDSSTNEEDSGLDDEGTNILSSDMKDLFLNGENSDFVMKVDHREFHVHKAILSARSPVLSAMLHHDMSERHSNTTEIVDCESGVFERFLLYLYTGHTDELSWDNVLGLYSLGDKYDLQHLRKVCVEFMVGNLCVDAFCDAIALAVKHNELSLLESAEDFFLQNVRDILVTNKWQMLMDENPVICNELFLKCYK